MLKALPHKLKTLCYSTLAFVVAGLWLTSVHADELDLNLKQLVAEGSEFCEGNFKLEDGSIERFDFNLDGEDDLVVLDEAGFSCEDSASLYCGSAGCVIHFITPSDYSYGLMREWEIIKTHSDQPIILLSLHGVSCDEVGTVPCYRAVSIFEGRFVSTKK